MAVTRHSSFDVTVNTIADRNALLRKVNHMTVLVKDAIADVGAGAGKATYRWDASDETWVLISKSTTETISFDTEELTITNGKVTPSNIILDNQIWNVDIVNGSLIMAQPRMEDLIIDYNGISGLEDYNGSKLRFTYAYGTISAQITSVISDLETKIDNFSAGLPDKADLDAMGIDAGTVNGLTVETAVPVGAVFTDTIYDDSGIITTLGTKADKSVTYTKTEVDAKIVELAPATDISSKADITYVDTKISDLIGLAPSSLNTLKEIADQLSTDEGAVASLTTVVGTKANSADVTSGLALKVDKVAGKQLSTEDYSTAEKTKLSGLNNYSLPVASSTVLGGIKIGSGLTESNGVVSVIAGGVADSVSWSGVIGTPTTLSGYGITDAYTKTASDTSLALKVDKVTGKGLSTEDYSTTEKTKLAGIAAGAQVNVGTDLSLGTITGTSIPLNSSTGTDVSLPVATTTLAGLMSGTDKSKLDGIAASANNYSLPVASSTVLGGVKAGTNVSIDANGVISANDSSVAWSEVTSKPTFATVATSGSYSDLSNKPTIPTVPTVVSSFTNDSGYQTSAQVNTAIQAVVGAAPAALNTLAEIATQLANDESAVSALTTTVSGKADKATTLSGYGITDAATSSHSHGIVDMMTNTPGFMSVAESIKLGGIDAGANNYSLPVATDTVLGGVKAGTNVSIDANGVISANDSSVAWSEVTSKPTTVAGYGITDAYTKAEVGTLAELTAILG